MASPEVIVRAIIDYRFCRSVEGNALSAIKEGQCYYLVEKHSSEWWIVSHPEFEDNVYVPASYVQEIGEGLSPQSVLENDDSAFITNDENHNHDEPQYANLAAIQSHIHGSKGSVTDEDVPHYYNLQNIKEALKRPPPKPHKEDQSSGTIGDNWLVYIDPTCDRKYYYNTETGESTWKPPRGVRSKPYFQKVNSFGTTAKLSVDEEEVINELEAAVADADDDVDQGRVVNRSGLQSSTTNQTKVDKRASMPVVNLIPDGWAEFHSSDGQTYYVHEVSGEKWFKSESEDGRFYYYNATGGESVWHLPLIPTTPRRHLSIDSSASVVAELKQQMGRKPRLRLGSTAEDLSLNDSQKQLDASSTEDLPAVPSVPKLPQLPPMIRTSPVNDPDRQPSPSNPEPVHFSYVFAAGADKKSGYLNKKKVLENGKKINFRKNWSQSFVMLSELNLFFYKDNKTALNKANLTPSKPEFVLDLSGAVVRQGAKGDVMKLGVKGEIKSSKKNLISVITQNGNGYFLQHDEDDTIHQWYTVIANNITLLSKQSIIRGSQGSLGSLDSDLALDEVAPSPGLKRKGTRRDQSSQDRKMILDDPNVSITEKKGIVNEILRLLIPKRPDVTTLQDKGIIKDAVFGCQSITKLCYKEKTQVPNFVMECMAAIEHRGLDADGIYRISGNLATIQKLRFMVDQEEKYDLYSQDLDVHVLSGALKLFFRELKEPLFPFNQYDAFVTAISNKNMDRRVKAVGDQLKNLPKANRETMKRLFRHLTKVIEKSKENRMQVGNVAIVFGPTLLWPEVEKGNVAVSMVYQNQIVECVLQNYLKFFN